MQCYGVVKVWKQLRRDKVHVARCTVARLMRRLGLQGVRRGQVVRTTVPDGKAVCPLDKVQRQFNADRPNQLYRQPTGRHHIPTADWFFDKPPLSEKPSE